jgi:hypothetical protein
MNYYPSPKPYQIDQHEECGCTDDGEHQLAGNGALQKKLSRRTSTSEMSSNRKLRSKRSKRRIPENLHASLTSISTEAHDALARFNSLTLDEKIALKMSGKLQDKQDRGGDESSVSSCCEDEGEICTKKAPKEALEYPIKMKSGSDTGDVNDEKTAHATGKGTLQKKFSRRASTGETSSNRKLRSKRSKRRIPEKLHASLTSISTEAQRDALARFQSLTLDEKIALKMSGKLQSDCMNGDESSVSSGYDDEVEISREEASKPPFEISFNSKEGQDNHAEVNHYDYSGQLTTKESLAGGSGTNITSKENNTDSYEETLRGNLAGQSSTANKSTIIPGTNRAESYDERLRQKLSCETSANTNSMQHVNTWLCQKCTYANKLIYLVCEVCNDPKKIVSSAWQCKACTYQNTAGTNYCSVCRGHEMIMKQSDENSGAKDTNLSYEERLRRKLAGESGKANRCNEKKDAIISYEERLRRKLAEG